MFARVPSGIVERLRGCSHGKDNEIIDLALLFGLHPIVSIKGSGRAVAARDLAGNLAGDIGYIEFFYTFDATLPSQQSLPCLLDPAGGRRHQSEPRDNHASHRGALPLNAVPPHIGIRGDYGSPYRSCKNTGRSRPVSS